MKRLLSVVLSVTLVAVLTPGLGTVQASPNRKIYEGNNQGAFFNAWSPLPLGTLLVEEGGDLPDEDAKGAYVNSGLVYDFYMNVFGRDSYDGNGERIISTVRMNQWYNPNYSAWIYDWSKPGRGQMIFGEGDGVYFTHPAQALDIVANEFTQGVTANTAAFDAFGQAYGNEPGAIQESIADIFAMGAEAYHEGNPDWMIGEDYYIDGSHPSNPGEAWRYMDNPTKDGYSADYYPNRLYQGSCLTWPSNDFCGIHGNSGIGNLAFYLMSEGGQHPQGFNTVKVEAIGFKAALHIWYRALTKYMVSSTNFRDARNDTVHAAADFYGVCSPAALSVKEAWDAVAVPQPWYVKKSPCAFDIIRNQSFWATTNYVSQAWTANSNVINQSQNSNVSSSGHTGSAKALLSGDMAGGNGVAAEKYLYQDVEIPETATKATLSFWTVIQTYDTSPTPDDVLRVQLQEVSSPHEVIKELATYSNLDQTYSFNNPNPPQPTDWVKKTFDLTDFRGKTVRVYFGYKEDASQATYFLIDDVELIVE